MCAGLYGHPVFVQVTETFNRWPQWFLFNSKQIICFCV